MGFIEGSIASSSTALPLQRLIESTMRGNAEAQAQTQVKEVAGKQMDATKKLQVTMTADPNDPGNPFVHVKNAKADQLNQAQDADVKNAYEAPHKNVDSAISQMNAGQFEDQALQSVGYPKERTDKTAADLSSYGADYRAQRDLGEPIIKAALKAAFMRTGAWDEKQIADQLNRGASYRNANAFQKTVAPVLEAQDRGTRLDLERQQLVGAADSRRNADLTQNRLQRKEYFDRLNGVVKDTDLSLVDPSEWIKSIEEQFGGEIPGFARAGVMRKGQQDVARALDTFTNKGENKAALGTYPDFASAKAAFGRQITPQQEAQFQRNYEAARTDYNLSNKHKRLALDLQAAEINQKKRANDLQQEAMSTGRVDTMVENIKKDGQLYYTLGLDKKQNAGVRAAVDAQLGMRPPNKLPDSDHQRLVTIRQGLSDTSTLRTLAEPWDKKGIPLTGTFIGALNEQDIQSTPTSKLISMARNAIPGFARLTPEEKQAYVRDAAQYYQTAVNLTAREVKANIGGRAAQQIFEYFKMSTPGITKSPEVRDGLLRGAESEFNRSRGAIENLQWGGEAPSNASTSGDVKQKSNDELFRMLMAGH